MGKGLEVIFDIPQHKLMIWILREVRTYCPVTIGMRGSTLLPCSRPASATVKAWARHIRAARERENLDSGSGTEKRTFADFARGESDRDLLIGLAHPMLAVMN